MVFCLDRSLGRSLDRSMDRSADRCLESLDNESLSFSCRRYIATSGVAPSMKTMNLEGDETADWFSDS